MALVGQIPRGRERPFDWQVRRVDRRPGGPAPTISSSRSGSTDRHSGEMNLLAGPQKAGADPHSPKKPSITTNTKIEIQSALISKDNRGLNICVGAGAEDVPQPDV